MRWGLLWVAFLAGCASSRNVENLPPEKESVRETVNARVADVADCYSTALKKNPKLSGKVVLEWEVNPIGDPKNVKVVEAVDPLLDKCLAKKITGWAFSPPPDGKVMKVRYPFDFSPVLEAAPASVPMAAGKPVVPTLNARQKICPKIETAYAENCVRDEKTNECVLDDKRMAEVLKLIRESPRFEAAYLADLDKLLKAKKPTSSETKVILEKVGEDCWTSIHLRMWQSVFYSFKKGSAKERIAEAKDVLKTRLAGLDVPSPNLSSVSHDIKVLELADESGLIKLKANAKKDLVYIRSKVRSLVKTIGREWKDGAADGEGYLENLNQGLLPDTYADLKIETSKVVPLVRKELKAVKPIRTQVKDWVAKYWKSI